MSAGAGQPEIEREALLRFVAALLVQLGVGTMVVPHAAFAFVEGKKLMWHRGADGDEAVWLVDAEEVGQ